MKNFNPTQKSLNILVSLFSEMKFYLLAAIVGYHIMSCIQGRHIILSMLLIVVGIVGLRLDRRGILLTFVLVTILTFI
jgi:hypothetical protein